MIDVYLDEEMDMPCPCDCGEWFDLNDGFASLIRTTRVICPTCHQSELDRTARIDTLKKGQMFWHNGDRFTVLDRYTKKAGHLIARHELGFEQNFYYEDDKVITV